MHEQQRFQRDPAIITRRIGAETVLVPVRSNTAALSAIFALNETAEVIWNALEQPMSVAQLVATLTDTFEVTPEQASDDVATLLHYMREIEVIQEVQ